MEGQRHKSCPRCRELEARVAELEGQLEQARRDAQRQSVRFPRRQRVENPKRPGRKSGPDYGQHQRRPEPQEVDRTIEVPVERHCPDCGAPLEITQQTQYQTDVPPVRPTVTQFQIEVGTCPRCKKRVQARHPEQTSDALGAARHTLGPNLQAMAASLKHGAGMAYDKMRRFFAESFGIQTAAATWVRAGLRLARQAQPTIARLHRALLRSQWIHADETGWRVTTQSAWLWVFASETITLYKIAGHRGHEVPQQMLAGFDGVLCCDGLSSYDVLEVVRLRCNGHVLRRIAALQETLTGFREQGALGDLQEVLQEAAHLKTRRPQMTGLGYQRRRSELENRFDDWLQQYRRPCLPQRLPRRHPLHPQLVRLRNHLARHRQEWLLYLYNIALPTTNNLAERQLRPGVISRKLGGCNKTWSGAWKTATLNSLVATCRQQTRSFTALVHRLLHARAPTAVWLRTLPSLT